MVNLKDLQDFKKAYIIEREEALKNAEESTKSCIEYVKDILLKRQKYPLRLTHNWLEKVCLLRLSDWLIQAKKLLFLEMKKENLSKLSINNEELNEAIAVYNIIRNKLCRDEVKIKGLYIIECRLDVINGNISFYELDKFREFKSPLKTDIQVYINEIIEYPYILKIGNEDLYYEIFNIKIEESIKYLVDLEDLNEKELSDLIFLRFKYRNIIKPFIIPEEVIDQDYGGLLVQSIEMYQEFLYRKNYSIKKKSLLFNLVVLSFPYVIGKLDISYFKTYSVYYSLYWILGKINNKSLRYYPIIYF